jgi:hypothetical protein
MRVAVAHEYATRVVLYVGPLMKVECEGIGESDTSQPISERRCEDGERAERAVHMKPQALVSTIGPNRVEIVDRPGVHRSGCSNHAERLKSFLPITFNSLG